MSKYKNQPPDAYRERILEAAQTLFAQQGLEAVSMYQIAKKAGIGQGSLYRRYADKGEICSDLLGSGSERFLTMLEQDLEHADGRQQPWLEHLQTCIVQIVDFIDQHAELLYTIKTEFTGKRQLTQFEHPIFQRLNGIMATLLLRALERGEIRSIDIPFTATALISALSPDLFLYQQKLHQAGKTQIADGIIKLFVDGIRAERKS
ncbi:TetR/AcrR family transcriptional regulator [Paenibacillus sp. NFR01]|uniref:TetR/AcrR family transcriptional regulator n=1 Tax=Paenibacillus sp. NFR01 TaxID=1566279 RepID=UPI0008B85656|nr:TetR/AcrR family transcriptional regulator [Paenibacillus sp. NFR01]SET34288.1 transcriptional regulator, TetR family [Paenibacillus sp. NFR01]